MVARSNRYGDHARGECRRSGCRVCPGSTPAGGLLRDHPYAGEGQLRCGQTGQAQSDQNPGTTHHHHHHHTLLNKHETPEEFIHHWGFSSGSLTPILLTLVERLD